MWAKPLEPRGARDLGPAAKAVIMRSRKPVDGER